MRTSALMWVLFVSGALTGCREPNAPQPTVAAEQARSKAEAVSAGQNTPAQRDGDVVALERLDVADASEESYCNIESIDGNAFIAGPLPAGPGQIVRGWLGHESAGLVQSPVMLLLDATGVVAGVHLQLSVPREDVANAYGGRADLRGAGFEAVMPGVRAGTYGVLLHYTFDGKAYRCDNGRQIIVR